MQRLDEKNRHVFDVIGPNGLFSVEKQHMKLSERDLSDSGCIPVYSSQTTNNGVMGFTSKTANFLVDNIPMLIFGDHTRSMDVSCHSFCVADNVKVLRPHDMSFDVLFYISCAWQKRIPDMDYARHWRKAKTVGVELPITDSGEPDYEYMAEYTTQKRRAILAKYLAYVEKRIAELGAPVEIPALEAKKWAYFKMPEIFKIIQRGKRLKNADHVSGTIPYVSSTANNNGVDDYIEATPGTRVFCDCISIANSGSVGTAFYEPFSFVASDHVTALKTEGISRYCYLFMTAMIEKQSSNFNFNREINDCRIKNMQIMLPITDSGKIDYKYMEQYIKNMMLRKYQQYLKFLNRNGGIAGEK